MAYTGTVKWFNTQKGYGFITPKDGTKDIFVHISELEKSGMKTLLDGQTVNFEQEHNKGKTYAVQITIVK